jgi:hypothetical protein
LSVTPIIDDTRDETCFRHSKSKTYHFFFAPTIGVHDDGNPTGVIRL